MTCKSCPGGNRCRCGAALEKQIRRAYRRFTSPQLEFKVGKKSFLDELFDAGEQVLGGMEKVLGTPETEPEPEPEPEPTKDDRHADWEKSWEQDIVWGVADNAHHAFPANSSRALCLPEGRQFDQVLNLKKMEHGKKLTCCTSCIIAVSNRG